MAYGKAGNWYVNNVEGGGGSSDFSTAEVTVIVSDTYTSTIIIFIPVMLNDPDIGMYANNNIYTEQGESSTENVILYKGEALGELYDFISLNPTPTVNIEGSGTYDGKGYFTITGDCTITIS